MTWKSHSAIAIAVTLPFNPSMLPIAVLGGTAPDWMEYILKFFGVMVKHREETHYLYIPLLIIFFSFVIKSNIVFWFGIGYLTHWFADSLTISGVPISQFDNHRIHFFGGKIRTGEHIEYVIAFGFLAISIMITNPISNIFEKTQQFNPYFIDYKELYKKKIIDEKTMRENRFKLF